MDIRIDTKFFQHPKTLVLQKKYGAEGVVALIRLWTWAAEERSSGVLHHLTKEMVEAVSGAPIGGFVDHLLEIHFLDWDEDTREYSLHNWNIRNPWAAGGEARQNEGRLSRLKAVNRAAYERAVAAGKTGLTKEEYYSLARGGENKGDLKVSLSPNPDPDPMIERKDRSDQIGGADPIGVDEPDEAKEEEITPDFLRGLERIFLDVVKDQRVVDELVTVAVQEGECLGRKLLAAKVLGYQTWLSRKRIRPRSYVAHFRDFIRKCVLEQK